MRWKVRGGYSNVNKKSVSIKCSDVTTKHLCVAFRDRKVNGFEELGPSFQSARKLVQYEAALPKGTCQGDNSNYIKETPR